MDDRVVWNEGLFMRPQHFQQSDRHFNSEIVRRTKELGSNNWGLFHINMDNHYLSSGKLVLNSVSGVMPDGTLFYIDSKEDTLSREIKIEDSSKSLYLALPLALNNSDEIQLEAKSDRLSRLVAQSRSDIANTNAGETSVAELLIAKYNFKLLFEDEINEGYETLKLCVIGDVSQSSNVSIDETYMPTYLHLHTASNIIAKLNELMSTLSFRVQKLSEKLSDASVQAAELGDYLMLQLLNRTQARLHYYNTQERLHPAELFLELSSLVGELAVFMKKEKRILEQFNYEHKEQARSFDLIFVELNDMLSMVLEQNSHALSVEKQKYGIYTARVSDQTMLKNSRFIFAIKADLDEAKLKKLLLTNLKIGSIETIRDLVNYHLGGFKLKSLGSAPRQIPYKNDYIYFELEFTQEDSTKLARSGGFAFHIATELPNVEYALWVIRND